MLTDVILRCHCHSMPERIRITDSNRIIVSCAQLLEICTYKYTAQAKKKKSHWRAKPNSGWQDTVANQSMVLSAQHVWDKVTIWMNSIAYFCVLAIVRHAWKTMWILKTFVRLFGLFFSTVAGYVIHILIRLKRVKVISIECEQNVTMLSMLVERINWPILDTLPHTWMCETQSVNVFVGHGFA